MKRPLAALTLLFCLGIFFADKIPLSFIPAYLLTGIILFGAILTQEHKPVFNICLLCLAFLLGVILLKNSRYLPACNIAKYPYSAKLGSSIIKGFINEEPREKDGSSSFMFRVEQIQIGDSSRSACGDILARVKSSKNFHYGQQLILCGDLRRPFSFNQSYRDYLKRQGIWLVMHVRSETDVTRLDKDKGSKVKRFSLWIKDKIEEVIFRYTSSGTAGILGAMILGDKSNIPGFILDSMVKSGTIHILAGQHTKMPPASL
ncbi:MAG: ComEC/Rec2 family competence protein [Candidatus Omnitrophica bacterium]|nr:ComEC/Rec2 family competence protein [Candidatus Omnitrophota bacterium]